MVSTTQTVIAHARTKEEADEVQGLLASRFAGVLTEKNSWGIESAHILGQNGFAVVLVGQSQAPVRARMADYLAGLEDGKLSE
jgi:hypothetical protein